ncbi:MAG: glycosyltransferase family 2 protein [Chloroflexi bacterium]|nr:glycosyltransferase family 2 protein [Chloroflexota bacterium]
MAGPLLSVVLPAYNEARRLPAALEELNRYLDERFPSAEVVVADDGSTDGTAAAVRAAAERWSRVRLLALPHRGKGHAVRQGMLAAQGEVRLFSDVDLAVPPEFIGAFVEAACSADVVIASRELPGAQRVGEPRRRHLMGRVFNLVVRLMTGLPYGDTQCGFKALRAGAAQDLFSRQRTDGFGFDVEVLYLARRWGLRVAERAVEWHYGAESRVRWRHPVQMVWEVWVVRWRSWCGRYARPG